MDHMGPSILYPHPPKNREKMGSELTGKILQNEFFNRVWQETTIITEFAIKNCLRIINQISKSSSESLIRAKFHFFLDFSRIFSSHFSLRYSQSLYLAHIHHSGLSSLPIAPLYLPQLPIFTISTMGWAIPPVPRKLFPDDFRMTPPSKSLKPKVSVAILSKTDTK